jgi:two-component system sensor histidine kinase QseC
VGPDGDGGQLSLKPLPDFPIYDRQLFCQIWALDGKLVGRSESAPGVRLTTVANGFSDTEVAGDRWRVFAVENTQLGLRVMVGEQLERARQAGAECRDRTCAAGLADAAGPGAS